MKNQGGVLQAPFFDLKQYHQWLDAKISLVLTYQLIVPSTLLAPATNIRTYKATKPQRYIHPNHWHMSYFFKIAQKGLSLFSPLLLHLCVPINLSYIETTDQASVVQRLDSAIHRINQYPVDSEVSFSNTYLLDGDLPSG